MEPSVKSVHASLVAPQGSPRDLARSQLARHCAIHLRPMLSSSSRRCPLSQSLLASTRHPLANRPRPHHPPRRCPPWPAAPQPQQQLGLRPERRRRTQCPLLALRPPPQTPRRHQPLRPRRWGRHLRHQVLRPEALPPAGATHPSRREGHCNVQGPCAAREAAERMAPRQARAQGSRRMRSPGSAPLCRHIAQPPRRRPPSRAPRRCPRRRPSPLGSSARSASAAP
mmetsp:Transcript_63983/g.187179  ORF Transcript_63983/g.187179 Transcript_63983/m.187179 type:complete len:226 (-) Transcript_63983:1640-2317(-)